MKLINATAIALLLTTGASFAESHVSNDDANMATDSMTSAELTGMQGDLIRSRDITGGAVYTMNEADDEGWDSEMTYNEIGADWNEIGEIEDLVLSKDGKIIGIVAEVGGFLDIGDKHVMIAVDDLSLVAVDDRTYTYVTRLSEEELEQMQGVDEAFWN